MKKRVLIFPAGTEIALEIFNALKYSKFVELFGGTSTSDHSEFVYKNLICNFPFVDEPSFLDYLNKTIEQYQIDCIYPAHDSVSLFLSDNRDKVNAQVIISDYKTTKICRSKKETYKFFADESFIPKTFEDIDDIEEYPVFVKPTVGQGSNGAIKINNKCELEQALLHDDSLVICEYLGGMEYTVDCLTDKSGKLLITKIRDRSRIKTGISVRSKNIQLDEQVKKIASIINRKLSFKGAWFFQLKRNSCGDYKLLEISPRIPGTMGLSRNQGINFPLLTLFIFWGYDVDIIDNGYEIELDRAFYSAYKIGINYDHIYLDFDDTLIVDGVVNCDLIKFLYQSMNKGKKIHLLSKHSTDLTLDLQKYHIDAGIFEEIKVIEFNDEKYKYISEAESIFIDDSFAERKKVHDVLGLPVFDVDMIESLIDWRF